MVTVVIPGGFLLLPLYLAYRAKKRPPALDFAGDYRRVPQTRPRPPEGSVWRRTLRKLNATGAAGRLGYR